MIVFSALLLMGGGGELAKSRVVWKLPRISVRHQKCANHQRLFSNFAFSKEKRVIWKTAYIPYGEMNVSTGPRKDGGASDRWQIQGDPTDWR